MGSADIMLQGSQSTQHVILALNGRVAGARAGADAQLKLPKAGVAALIAHEGVQLLVVDVPVCSSTSSK